MTVESLAACLKALVGELIADEKRYVLMRFAMSEGAEPEVAREVFGVE